MNRFLIALVLVAACGGKKSEEPKVGARKPTDTTTCPMPKATSEVRQRFPVGTIPVYRVEGMVHGAKCHDVFVPNDVVKAEGTSFRLVAEGTFYGHCPDEPDHKRIHEAVKPAKAVIEVNKLAIHEGELGPGKPVVLDSAAPDKYAGVAVTVVDRCGDTLWLGHPGNITTWTPEAACETVAKVVPYEDPMMKAPEPQKAQQMRLLPVGPGSCKVTAEVLGVTGDVTVTVK